MDRCCYIVYLVGMYIYPTILVQIGQDIMDVFPTAEEKVINGEVHHQCDQDILSHKVLQA